MIKDRLAQFIKYKNLKISHFERIVGLSNGSVAKTTDNIRPRTVQSISACFPDLNIDWLLTGAGSMIKNEITPALTKEVAPVKSAIRDEEMTLETVSPDENRLPQGIYHEDEIPEQFIAYLVPMAAMGGDLTGFESDGISKENCEKVISPVANAEWVIPVCGDSMEPEYPNGSRVYVRRIFPEDFIAWGNVFVLDTTNGLILKVVKKSNIEGHVLCESLNPSGRYTPFDVPIRSIRAMYRVLICVSLK